MFNIKIGVDKPDANRLKATLEKLMQRGIRVGNVTKTYNYFSDVANTLALRLKYDYKIENPNSPKQIEQFLINSNNPTFYDVCCQNDKWTSNQEALETLKAEGYEFADVLLQYRKAKKFAESAKSLLEATDNNGLIHPTVSLTKTNRISYTGPALMNIPKKLLWDVITPMNPNNVLWSVDIKNQEPSILINILNSQKLKEALVSDIGLYEHMFSLCFEPRVKCTLFVLPNCSNEVVSKTELMQNKGIPPVLYTPVKPDCLMRFGEATVDLIDTIVMRCPVGSQPIMPKYVDLETDKGRMRAEVVWSEIPDKDLSKPKKIELEGSIIGVEPVCEGVYRKEFKTSWNAMTYGSSKRGIMAICKHIDGDKVYNFFYNIPEMKAYQKQWKNQANMGVQYSKTVFGTVLCANKPDTKQLARSLMDLPIQGTAADILDLIIAHFYEEIEKRGIGKYVDLYYTRHDEPIIEVDRDWQNKVGEQYVESTLRDIFVHQVDNWTPFKVEIKPVNSELSSLIMTEAEED